MKKSILALLIVALCSIGATAAEVIVRDVASLPQTAQKFLTSNFKKANVSFIKIDKTLGIVRDYEVVLTDGTEIDFDSDGVWDKIEMPGTKSVPSAIVPQSIASYVSKNYPGQRIVSIDKERHSYDVELQGGLDLVFDRAGNFKRIDN